MALESWQYGDPETVAIRRQEAEFRKIKQCGGGIPHQKIEKGKETLHPGDIKRVEFGIRCKNYTTKAINARY